MNPGNCCLQLYLLLLLLFFCPKTDRADQTVRPRDLKLGQIVELNLGRTYQSLDPIGLTGALQRKIQKFQTFLALPRKPLDVVSKTLHRCNPWVSPNKSGVRNFCSTTHGFSAKLCYIRNLLLRTSPRIFNNAMFLSLRLTVYDLRPKMSKIFVFCAVAPPLGRLG